MDIPKKPAGGPRPLSGKGAQVPEGFSDAVELVDGAYEYAREGKDAAYLIGRLSARSRRMSLKDLEYV